MSNIKHKVFERNISVEVDTKNLDVFIENGQYIPAKTWINICRWVSSIKNSRKRKEKVK